MSEEDGLICAYILTPHGGWREVGWEEVRRWRPADGLLWLHLDRNHQPVKDYLRREAGLDALVHENLLAEETRPRALEFDDRLLVNLRGVNLNPGADPEDMVSIRMWIGPERIITTRHRRLMAVSDIRERIAAGRGPQTAGDFFVEVTARLIDRMSPVLEGLDEAEDELEDRVVTGDREAVRAKLAEIRRQAIGLRRYLAPQRDALSRIQGESLSWLDARQKLRLREVADRLTRHVEDLDAIRERAAIIQDEVANRISEQMNKNMYLLAIVATVLLPLGVITGLLGINVDGIPGAEKTPWAFSAVVGVLAALVTLEVVVMRRLKWF